MPKGYKPVDTELALVVGTSPDGDMGGGMMAVGAMHMGGGRHEHTRTAVSQRRAPGF